MFPVEGKFVRETNGLFKGGGNRVHVSTLLVNREVTIRYLRPHVVFHRRRAMEVRARHTCPIVGKAKRVRRFQFMASFYGQFVRFYKEFRASASVRHV